MGKISAAASCLLVELCVKLLLTATVDVDVDDEWSSDEMQTYVAEDFQCSTVDVHTPSSSHKLADDHLAGSTASFEHSSTVCIMSVSFPNFFTEFFIPLPNLVWPEAYCFCPVRPCVRPCVRPETFLTRYLAEHLTQCHQTYINDALWDRDERFTTLGQKVKGQGHSGIKYAGNSTFWAC